MIDVILYPPLSKDRRIIRLPCPESDSLSVGQLIHRLPANAGNSPDMVGFGIADNPVEHFMIFLNDRIVDAHAVARDGDTVKILLSMSGG